MFKFWMLFFIIGLCLFEDERHFTISGEALFYCRKENFTLCRT